MPVKIVRHVEKRMICRDCDTAAAGEMPILPIERGKPGPGLPGAYHGRQIRRSHPAPPPIRDVRPAGNRHLPLHHDGLGRPRIRSACAARPADQGTYCGGRSITRNAFAGRCRMNDAASEDFNSGARASFARRKSAAEERRAGALHPKRHLPRGTLLAIQKASVPWTIGAIAWHPQGYQPCHSYLARYVTNESSVS